MAKLRLLSSGGPLHKRIPGERNPTPDSAGPEHVARESWMANGHGTGDYGIVRGVFALLDWRKRRKAAKNR